MIIMRGEPFLKRFPSMYFHTLKKYVKIKKKYQKRQPIENDLHIIYKRARGNKKWINKKRTRS